MKKRMLSIILTICMIMSVFAAMSVTASAAESGKCGDNLTWTLDDEGTLTISGTGYMYGYIWEYHDIPWDNFRDKILSVIIEDGVTSIRNYSFYNCINLKNIIIPNSVTSIGGCVFEGCSSLTNITIPDSVVYIGVCAFKNCSSLTDIKIPDSVTSIDNGAFEDCSSLTSITIPDSVTSIGYKTFSGCNSLENIIISNNVTSIDSSAFYNTDYYNTSSNWKNGILYIGNCLIEAKDSLSGTCEILEGTRLIAASAFSNCTKLSNIIIPDSVTYIGDSAFSGCSNLTNITIPDSVTYIGNSVFYNCNLTNITIPDSVTSIGNYAFYSCNLTNITIPDSVTSIGYKTFSYCSRLTNIIIPDSVTSIGSSAFENCRNLKKIKISNSVTSIENNTFYECTNLKSITIPKSIISIKEGAFYNCENLTNVYYLSDKTNWKKIKIGNNNSYLLYAEKYYNTSMALTGKISMAKYDGAKVSGMVNFDYSDEEGTLYLAVFDKSGRLEKFVKYDIQKGSKSQYFEIPVANAKGHSLKAMFWDGNYTPLGLSDEVTIYGSSGSSKEILKTTDFSIVAKTPSVYYDDKSDENRQQLTVFAGTSNAEKDWVTQDNYTFSDSEVGDVIQFAFDQDRYIFDRVNCIKFTDIAAVLDGKTTGGTKYNWNEEQEPSEDNNMQSYKFDYRFKKAGTSNDETYASSTLGTVPYSRASMFNVMQVLDDDNKIYVTKNGFDADGNLLNEDDYEEYTISSTTRFIRMESNRKSFSPYAEETETDFTFKDLKDAKNYGADCSKVLITSLRGVARLIVVYN